MTLLIQSLVVLGALGGISALVLYWVAKKFHVDEDVRIDEVEQILPAGNCGGCGYPGCRAFAEACVLSEAFTALYCPVGGNTTMNLVAGVLGKEVVAHEPTVAVLLCQGSCNHRPKMNEYDGVKHCYIAHNLYSGETACSWGCLGFGDCELSCAFDAIHVNPETHLPEINEQKCTSCGACVKACPKLLIELRKQGANSHRIYVGCRNKDKGAEAKKACEVACIACNKCVKACPSDAILLSNQCAYIDEDKCVLCGLCVDECPTHAIINTKKN